MPKSRVRSKAVYTPPPRSTKAKVSPRWLAPTMVGCLLVGLAWIATVLRQQPAACRFGAAQALEPGRRVRVHRRRRDARHQVALTGRSHPAWRRGPLNAVTLEASW